MASSVKPLMGRALYGLVFVAGLPAAMVAWARASASWVRLPAVSSPIGGAALGLAGAALMVAGAWALWRRGGGLPMNAFPPERYVTTSVYRWLSHPLYAGFCLASAGVSVAVGSASGLWLVTPTAVAGCLALVWGYERDDLAARFGELHAAHRPWLSLPRAGGEAPSTPERLSTIATVMLPWLALYELIGQVLPPDAVASTLPWERALPVWEWTELIYLCAYPLFVCAPFVAPTRNALRTFVVESWGGMLVGFAGFLLLPFIAPPRPFEPTRWLGHVLAAERALDFPTCALPSFHAMLSLFAAAVWAERLPRLRWAPWTLAAGVSLSCVTTGMHAVLDVAAGVVVWLGVRRRWLLWEALRRSAERLANAFAAFRIGPVRVINYAGWAGLAASGGVVAAAGVLGPGHHLAVVVTGVAALLGAGLWAQLVEGSPLLARPYGFYGGVLGLVAGTLASSWLGTPSWWVLGAYAVAGPWIQAAGRVRCLIQGCCHGREAPPRVGIVVTSPHSRVSRLSTLGGTSIHPTPLYSMLWSAVTGAALLRLWSLDVLPHVVAGLFLLLNGLGRFVEEALRGEPQTPVYARLRLYQWVSIASAVAGVLVTALGRSAPFPQASLTLEGTVAGVAFGVLVAVAAGVDFPASSRRFSRLA